MDLKGSIPTVGAAAVEAYARDGYFVHRGLFERAAVTQARDWLDAQDHASLARTWTEQEPGVPLAVMSGADTGEHPVAQIARDIRIQHVAAALVGGPVYLWASKVNVKAAWCGTAEYYHQDLIYWKPRGYPGDDLMTCMVFLEPHAISNAALHVLPGTHRLGVVAHEPFVNINGLGKYMVPPATLDQLSRQHGVVAIEGEPGDAVFFHAGVVHGSSHNISPQRRAVVITQFNAVGNEPVEVASNARQFNLRRAELELREAERRLAWFKQKYDDQLASQDVTFTAPIPAHERQD